MNKIPKQLHKKGFRFIKIKNGTKQPLENKWTNENNYRYNEPEFLQYLNQSSSYGVVCGYGNLAVIDCDSKDISDTVQEHLPVTFTIRTGSGNYHYYYIIPDLEKKIILNDNEEGKHHGEVQFTGSQVLGPGSLHPNGEKYKINNNIEIAEVSIETVRFALRDFLPTIKVQKEEEDKDFDILNLVDISVLKKSGDEYQGSHPIHGSKGGKNFCVNETKQVWHCFRCNSGGGALSLIALKEGIISCKDAVPGGLKGKEYRKTLQIANEKYGYKKEDKIKQLIDEEKFELLQKYSVFIYNDKGMIKTVNCVRLAKLILNEHEHHFLTTRDTKEIYYYNGCFFELNGETIIQNLVEFYLDDFSTEHRKTEVVGYIKDYKYVERSLFDSHKNLLNMENGVYDLTSGEFKKHSPDYYFLNKLPITYEPNVDCPKIKKFLRETLYEEDIPVIQEMIGYCLHKEYPYHKSFMFIGDGKNGKSTLVSLIRCFLGIENVCSISLQNLELYRFSLQELYGKYANLYPDLNQKALKNSGIFKMITGEDYLNAEIKFKGFMRFINFAKLIFSANKIPKSFDDTYAFFRRWILINFPNTFDGKTCNPFILREITDKNELSGLFNWALEGYRRLFKQGGFSYSRSTEEVMELYKTLSDPIYAFIEGFLTTQEGNGIAKAEVYNKYVKWAKKQKLSVIKNNLFTQELKRHIENLDIGKKSIDGKMVPAYWNIGWKEQIDTGINEESSDNESQRKLTLMDESSNDNFYLFFIENIQQIVDIIIHYYGWGDYLIHPNIKEYVLSYYSEKVSDLMIESIKKETLQILKDTLEDDFL